MARHWSRYIYINIVSKYIFQRIKKKIEKFCMRCIFFQFKFAFPRVIACPVTAVYITFGFVKRLFNVRDTLFFFCRRKFHTHGDYIIIIYFPYYWSWRLPAFCFCFFLFSRVFPKTRKTSANGCFYRRIKTIKLN